jgi:sugar/nucleoside kinase (ribokinase family)
VTRRGIVLAGTVVLDIVHMIERWPDEEQIAFIRSTIEASGGPPHNAAAGLIKLGADFPVEMICIVGDDAAADTFKQRAAELGIDLAQVISVAEAKTDVTHVMTSLATGRRTFFFSPGANGFMTADQMLPADDAARIYYLGSPGISPSMDASDGWRNALRAARARGFKTAMELCPVPPDLQRAQVLPCLPLLDYFIINDSEAEAVTGLSTTTASYLDRDKAEAACKVLLDHGVGELACIHHPDGAVAVTKAGQVCFAAAVRVPQHEIVGSVGAGDAFYAGMLLGIHEGWALEESLALANAAAATSLHSATTSASIRPWAACLAYAKKMGLKQL